MKLPVFRRKIDALTTVFGAVVWIILSASSAFAFCPSQCQCNDLLLRASCVYARLDVVPILLNPATQTLDLSHNRISAVQQSFDFYVDLRSLNLSHNAISSLGQKQLQALPELNFLNLSHNLIRSLDGLGVFSGLPKLRVLDLSFNHLEKVGVVFDELRSLEVLILTGNQITHLHNDALVNLSRLQTLQLSDNRLQILPDLGGLLELRELDVSDNYVAVLDGGVFATQTRLKTLCFRNNSVHSVHPNAFDGLQQLQNLDLSYNRMENVADASLLPLASVKVVDLSGNFFTEFDGNLIQNLRTVNTLILSHSPNLQAVVDNGWNVNNSLSRLVVSHNYRLKSFPTSILSKLRNLKELSLEYNSLKTFQECALAHLDLLDLGGNPFHCNCSVFWLWKLYHSSNNSRYVLKDITCAFPLIVRDRNLFGLEESKLCLEPNDIILLSLCAGVGVMVIVTCIALCCWKKSRTKNEPHHSSRSQFKMLPFSASVNCHTQSSTLAANGEFFYNTSQSSKRVPATAV